MPLKLIEEQGLSPAVNHGIGCLTGHPSIHNSTEAQKGNTYGSDTGGPRPCLVSPVQAALYPPQETHQSSCYHELKYLIHLFPFLAEASGCHGNLPLPFSPLRSALVLPALLNMVNTAKEGSPQVAGTGGCTPMSTPQSPGTSRGQYSKRSR